MKKVVGKQTVDYVSKKTGQPVKGVTLHLTYPDDRIIGLGTESVFVSAKSTCYSVVMCLELGDDVDLFYNRYGSVEDIRPVAKK